MHRSAPGDQAPGVGSAEVSPDSAAVARSPVTSLCPSDECKNASALKATGCIGGAGNDCITNNAAISNRTTADAEAETITVNVALAIKGAGFAFALSGAEATSVDGELSGVLLPDRPWIMPSYRRKKGAIS